MSRIRWTRTLGVFLVGVVLSIVVPILSMYFLQPHFNQLIARVFTTPPNNHDWDEIWSALRRSAAISTYIIEPVAGLAVGLFVGLFQRERPAIIAAGCLIPEFLHGFFVDHAKFWMRSAVGILHFTFQHSLPFVAAIVAATLCHRLLSNKATVSVEDGI
jgi:ABC-type glycerol-3-phosphate transport system permease component